jgi:glyoxylate/hydroxypyruvate reductase
MSFNILVLCTVEPAERWREPLRRALPDDDLYFDAAEVASEQVDIVISDSPPQGVWRQFSRLRMIQSLWMGVDRWLDDASLPANVPVTRMIDPGMVTAMTETVLAHVLHAHLRHDVMRRQQTQQRWRELFNPVAAQRSVGIMGLGNLGTAAGRALAALNFQMQGWSRTRKDLPDVRCFAGESELAAFLAASEIVVCLLPLTTATRGIANAEFFGRMREHSVFVSLGRGPQVVEAALLAALEAGRVRHAILDVFMEEPLPPAHPFWTHPRVTVTPHCASMAQPESGAQFVAENINRLRAGEALLGVVDPVAGY